MNLGTPVGSRRIGGDHAHFKSHLVLAPDAGWGVVVLINT